MDKKEQDINTLLEFLPSIQERVDIEIKKNNGQYLYVLSHGTTYEFIGVNEVYHRQYTDTLVTRAFIFRDIKTGSIVQVNHRRATNSVSYDGFTDSRYPITQQEERDKRHKYWKETYTAVIREKRRSARKPVTTKCAICGKPLTKLNQKYCSDECRAIAKAQQPQRVYTRVCLNCGKEFTTTSYAKKYCSKECTSIVLSKNATLRHQTNKDFKRKVKVVSANNLTVKKYKSERLNKIVEQSVTIKPKSKARKVVLVRK